MTDIEEIERAMVIEEARTWLGTPYHPHARVKGAGVDCAMLLIEVYRACNLIPDVDPGHYAPDWHLHRSDELYLKSIIRYAREVPEPLPGDVALFRFGRCVSHGAIVIAWPTVIHAYRGEGCVLADAAQRQLAGRLAGFYSIWK